MANRLTMATIEAILTLHKAGYSARKIGELLHVHRETVSKHIAAAEAKPAERAHGCTGDEPTGGAAEEASTAAGASSGPESQCEPFREVILAKLEQELSARRIHQDLCAEHGFAGSYWCVRRFAAKLKMRVPRLARRLETAAGEEAQIDFGTAAPVVAPDGGRRRPWVLRVVLSHSRKGYSEAVWRQSTDEFIACLENAFWHFGGAPRRLVIDNLKAAVKQADWYDPEVHPKLQSFAAHYGAVFSPTRPYTPEHKGKVERGVAYVKDNALKGRQFSSLAEQNAFLWEWEASVADTRLHGTTKEQVAAAFQRERPLLTALPQERFPDFREARRVVHRDGHVEVDKAFYSVPAEHLRRRVWVRWDSRLVRVFNDRFEQIALHAKAEPGRFRTSAEHIPPERVSAVERGTQPLLRQIGAIGPRTGAWAEAVMRHRGVEAIRVLVGLKALAGKHRGEDLERACGTALAHQAWRLRTIRQLLARQAPEQGTLEFLEEHPIIRPLSDYSLESLDLSAKECQG